MFQLIHKISQELINFFKYIISATKEKEDERKIINCAIKNYTATLHLIKKNFETFFSNC